MINSPKSYDLHCHSTASDGVFSPTQIIERAVEQKIDVLSLTDHDTIAGYEEAKLAAQQNNLELIPGCEISTVWNGHAIHVVGLSFDPLHPALQELLSIQTQLRAERALLIGKKLEKCGVENAYQGAKELAPGEVTRAHFARYLVSIGKVKNDSQAFKRYLTKGKTAYVEASWCDMQQAIKVIQQAGGIAICAHPLRYKMNNRRIKLLLSDFKKFGGDAVEVAHPGQSPDQESYSHNG